ncbi:MAG: hypothetical protein KKD63_13195 [Proteobacteria bacterium]|nr:hypothetical protein [Pseudomonadota bacterium]MDP2105964.1 hypothetical protein [Desulfobulbaceae bacterium]
MKKPNEIWNELGELPEEEAMHVLTKLFFTYETQLEGNGQDPEALNFFRNLGNALEQTTLCNLNRR